MNDGFDLSEINAFIERLDAIDTEKACKEMMNEVGKLYLSAVVKKTPVGEYKNNMAEYSKTGGTLRRGWHTDGVRKQGDDYVVEIINSAKNNKGMPYGLYVEEGHRQNVGQFVPAIGKRLVRPAVAGQHFVRTACEQAEPKVLPAVQKVVRKYLKG